MTEDHNEFELPNRQRDLIAHELQGLRKKWWVLMFLGILLLVGGIAAISYPFFVTVGAVITLGAVMLVAGITTIMASFWARRWGAFLVQLLVGILYTLLGLLIAEAPVVSSAALTMLVASFAIVGGSFRAIASLTIRFPQWGWMLLGGVVSVIFGVVVLRHFPEATLSLLGFILGIDLIFSGMNWLMLGLEVRTIPAEQDPN